MCSAEWVSVRVCVPVCVLALIHSSCGCMKEVAVVSVSGHDWKEKQAHKRTCGGSLAVNQEAPPPFHSSRPSWSQSDSGNQHSRTDVRERWSGKHCWCSGWIMGPLEGAKIWLQWMRQRGREGFCSQKAANNFVDSMWCTRCNSWTTQLARLGTDTPLEKKE